MPHQQIQAPQYVSGVQGAHGVPQNFGNSDPRSHFQNQNQVLGSRPVARQSPNINNPSLYGNSFGVDLASIDNSVIAPPSFNGTISNEADLTLIPVQSETVKGQARTIDAQFAKAMNTAAEPALQSPKSEDDVDTAVLNHVSSYIKTIPSTPVPARTALRGHKRKISDQSNLSSGQKKTRGDKVAERSRVATEREAAEPPMTLEEVERKRRLNEIEAKIEIDKRAETVRTSLTMEELRIYLSDDEVANLRMQLADTEGINQWSDDEFRRKYVEQGGKFYGTASKWLEKQQNEKEARKKSKRRERRNIAND